MSTLSVDQVIEKAGGTRRIASALGIGTSAVRGWRWQNYIPALRALDVADLAGVDPRQIPRKPAGATDAADLAAPGVAAE